MEEKELKLVGSMSMMKKEDTPSMLVNSRVYCTNEYNQDQTPV